MIRPESHPGLDSDFSLSPVHVWSQLESANMTESVCIDSSMDCSMAASMDYDDDCCSL